MNLSCLRKAFWIIATLVAVGFAAPGVASAHDGHRTGSHHGASATAPAVSVAVDSAAQEEATLLAPAQDSLCTDGCCKSAGCKGAGCCVANLAALAPPMQHPPAAEPERQPPQAAWPSALGASLLEPPTPRA